MNWTDPIAVAGYIGVGSTGLLGLILRARKTWVRDNRDVTYDTEQTKWVEGLQGEIKQLRADKEAMFLQRLEDVRTIAEVKALNEFLTKELDRMRVLMASMELNMKMMKAKLASIDSTISTTDLSPLQKD